MRARVESAASLLVSSEGQTWVNRHISLGGIAERINLLVVHCDSCGRRAQYPAKPWHQLKEK
jgi:hypothetical protein